MRSKVIKPYQNIALSRGILRIWVAKDYAALKLVRTVCEVVQLLDNDEFGLSKEDN